MGTIIHSPLYPLNNWVENWGRSGKNVEGIMNARCKPGDLCLIIKGSHIGSHCTVLRHASKEEVISLCKSLCDIPVIVINYEDPIWLIDVPVLWNASRMAEFTIPYQKDSSLLPINPPADMKDDMHEHEKPWEFASWT
jgi:hypothetical protein